MTSATVVEYNFDRAYIYIKKKIRVLNDLVNPVQSAVSLVNLAGVLRFYDWTLRVPSVADRPDGITTTINPARGCVPVFKLPSSLPSMRV